MVSLFKNHVQSVNDRQLTEVVFVDSELIGPLVLYLHALFSGGNREAGQTEMLYLDQLDCLICTLMAVFS